MTNLCVCPPFKKSFTSGETPGPGLWRLYISIHNWWPGPRQTAHYTCNMDSLLVSDACSRLDLTLSHHCVWRGNGEGTVYVRVCLYVQMCACDRVCVWYGCCGQKMYRPCVLKPQIGSCFWLLIPGLVFQYSVFLNLNFVVSLFYTFFGSCEPSQ